MIVDKKYSIPSSIASKLEQIKQYMGMHSVTAFVGAGFSMNAEKPNHVKMKTWKQLRETFLDKLYPNNEEDRLKDGNDVVRLASLVDAQFGHNELDNILEDALPDKLVRPGELHRMLVSLPWKDLLTTNYDTLIERAASQVITNLKLVTNKETLLYQPSPRIIKLHGSFPNIRPYIMTQEDYRRYPIERPEMVNTAKQCFLESLVCLVGFSGEDPNFRAWIGWLKDVIGQGRLCPTYLITYSKEFHDAEKSLLSKLGIDIVNLAEIGGVDDYYSAYEFFFEYLKERTSKWNGKVNFDRLDFDKMNDEEIKNYVINKTKEMQSVRESYPGWLILPKEHEKNFEYISSDIFVMWQLYKRIDDDSLKLRFLYEINWRLNVAVVPHNIDWFLAAIEGFADHIADIKSDEKWMMEDLILSLLDVLRLNGKDERFKQLCSVSLENEGIISARHIHYRQALYWMTKYDSKLLKSVLSKWKVDLSDYENCLQKANIFYYIGEKLDAFHLLEECKNNIARFLLQNKNNLYAKTCLAYIQKTISWLDNEKMSGNEDLANFAVGESLDSITDRIISKAYKESPIRGYTREHKFRIGYYVNSWNLGSSGFVPEYLYPCKWWMIKERIGLAMFQINQDFTRHCILKMFDYSSDMAWNIMMLSASGKVVDEVLGREQLVQISEEKANEYFDTYISLFESVKLKRENWENNKVWNVLPKILSRLCTKIDQNRVMRFVKAALNWRPISINKELEQAYDCLNNENLSVIWVKLLTDKYFETIYNRNGYALPSRYMLNFKITDRIINRIVDELASTDKETVLQAIIMIEIIWNRQELQDVDRKKIIQALRAMRKSENVIPEAVYTYTYVEADEEETERFNRILQEALSAFLNNNFEFDHSSRPLSSWEDCLQKINALRSFFSEERKKNVLLHTCELIEQNKSVFEKDDENDFFGGMRKFTRRIITNYQELLLNTNLDSWTNEEFQKVVDQIDWLLSVGYRCLPMKVKVQIRNQQEVSENMVLQIQKTLFGKESSIQVEGINAFFVLKDNGKDIEKIITYIFDNFSLADSVAYKELLILFANLVVRGYDEDDFNNRIVDFLNNIHQFYNSYELGIVGLADLQHYANYVAGALSVKAPTLNIPVFKKDKVGFNDVVIGYDKGVEFARLNSIAL